jgi:hypothetical protein
MYRSVYQIPQIAPINEVSMPETPQPSKLELVRRALKQMENELFALREPGIQELQSLINDVADR